MKLVEMSEELSVIKLQAQAAIPNWAFQGSFFSITRTADELSVVCESRLVPSDIHLKEKNWKCLKVQGPLDFSLTGILSSIANPLAAAKISIFAISTFDTDYVMVKNDNLKKAKLALQQAGFEIEEKN
ncbi:hypothetical protein D3C87_1238910 [compost metagenome]